MNHLSIPDIIEQADGSGSPDSVRHLESCPECRHRLETFRTMEALVRRHGLEEAPEGLTRRVMERLGAGERPSASWFLLKFLAPLFALGLVAGVVYVVLSLAGMFHTSGMGQSVDATQSIYRDAGTALENAVSTLNGWLGKILPAGGSGVVLDSKGLVLFLGLFFGGLALLDRYIFMPILRKRVSPGR